MKYNIKKEMKNKTTYALSRKPRFEEESQNMAVNELVARNETKLYTR
jgi:hypothetical protein